MIARKWMIQRKRDESMMAANYDETLRLLAARLTEAIPRNVRTAGEDIERSFRQVLRSGLDKMDLVSREEFDVQAAVLARTREKLEALEKSLTELEQRFDD